MVTLKIQNFGPIRDSGVVALNTLLLIIGRQSAGKSAFMKVLCHCRWVEKRIMNSTEEDRVAYYTHNGRFAKELMQFHRIYEQYFKEDTKIIYDGDVLRIDFQGTNKNAKITRKSPKLERRYNTKLCYLPAERNLVSAIRNIDKSYKTTERDVLFNFIMEWNEAKENYDAQHPMNLSLTDRFSYYSKDNADTIVLPNGTPISSFFASSGVQSVMPVDVMSDYLQKQVGKTASFSKIDLSNTILELLNQKKGQDMDQAAVAEDVTSRMKKRFVYQSMQLYIEEPEQNLFPDAQCSLVQNLVRRIKKAEEKGAQHSSLVMTTHSPYVLSTLNVMMAGSSAKEKMPDNERIDALVDESTLLPLSEYSAYYINEEGCFVSIKDTELPMFSGINLDGVSDWVNDRIGALNEVVYGE